MNQLATVGIHLGATYCSLAYFDDSGNVRLAELEQRTGQMPSVVVRHQDGTWFTGYKATALASRYNNSEYYVVECPLYLLGTDEIQLGDEVFLPEEILGVLLRSLIQQAAMEIGLQEAAALTFPPSISNRQTNELRKAAELAGLKITTLVPEPIASLTSVIPDDDSRGRWLVYHLGHLSFDATIVQRNSPLEMIAHQIASVGGRDWTCALAEIVAARIQSREDVDIRQDPHALQHLVEQSEGAKIELSNQDEARINVKFESEFGKHREAVEAVTREEFEKSTRCLVDQTMACVQETLNRQDISTDELDGTIVAGKSANMPMIRWRLEEQVGVAPIQEAKNAAIGAAIVASRKATETSSTPPASSRSELRSNIELPVSTSTAAPSGYRFAVFYSEQLEVGQVGSLIAYAYWPTVDPRSLTKEAASRIQRPAGAKITAGIPKETGYVTRDQEIIVTVDVDGLDFESQQARLKLWSDQQSAEFRFRCRESSAGRTLKGFVNYWLGRILIATTPVRFVVAVDDLPEEFRAALAEFNATPYRNVFPSYSHDDEEIVEQIEIYADAFGDTYFRDVKKLRTGETWNPRLMQFIHQADVFQLFWSPNAAESPYVRQEWIEALKERSGRGDPYFVRPVYWTDEPTPDPPKDLGHINFAKLPIE